MDKQIKDLDYVINIGNDDKVIIQQMGGGVINTSFKNLVDIITEKLRDKYEIVKEEIIYQYDGDGYANFSTTVNLNSGKKFTDYKYVEIYCRTGDGYINMSKVHDPQPGKIITVTLGNVGYGGYLFMKCRCYELKESSLTTALYNGQKMAGEWFHKKHDADTNVLATVGEQYVGIAKIVGYK